MSKAPFASRRGDPAVISGLSEIETKVITNRGVRMGTVQYMRPEHVLGRDADARSDLFSLAVLFEMATGRILSSAPPDGGHAAGHAIMMRMPVFLSSSSRISSGPAACRFLHPDSSFDIVRSDPRFAATLKKLNFPSERKLTSVQ
jgi:serine/threonine protein kinase